MGQSWSGVRKELEENFICDSLKGRVKYFLTHYHNAPDKYGRVCIRVDNKEVLHGNPYDFYVKGYYAKENKIKNKLNIPDREFVGNSYLYDKENEVVEDMVREMACKDGVFEIYDFTDAIYEYKKLNMYNAKIGSQVKINTEEGFAEGFLDKRLLYSSVSSILIYSEQEIEDAKNVVKSKFKSDFKGCELTDLWYSEEVTISSLNRLSKQYNADEAIVLLSNFDVDSYGGDGNLNPNKTYTDWHWVLVRNKEDNKWILINPNL